MLDVLADSATIEIQSAQLIRRARVLAPRGSLKPACGALEFLPIERELSEAKPRTRLSVLRGTFVPRSRAAQILPDADPVVIEPPHREFSIGMAGSRSVPVESNRLS